MLPGSLPPAAQVDSFFAFLVLPLAQVSGKVLILACLPVFYDAESGGKVEEKEGYG